MHPRLELGIFCTESIRDSRCSTATVKPMAKYLYTFSNTWVSNMIKEGSRPVVKCEVIRSPNFVVASFRPRVVVAGGRPPLNAPPATSINGWWLVSSAWSQAVVVTRALVRVLASTSFTIM
ncbi:hypothetical protein EVAR_93274_1 [Eumeta japonica]|uniref:Uncharacterized protein n=1 Tax=Eumeta variegata TaxID=151549 RepID=A0A4C1TYA7_EUMVA|nr:hypothetical protein EVAR_93274_1 [Eumeta japonica]